MWNAPHCNAIRPSRTSSARQSTSRASSAPYCLARSGTPRQVGLVVLAEIGGVGVRASRPCRASTRRRPTCRARRENAMPTRSPTGSDVRTFAVRRVIARRSYPGAGSPAGRIGVDDDVVAVSAAVGGDAIGGRVHRRVTVAGAVHPAAATRSTRAAAAAAAISSTTPRPRTRPRSPSADAGGGDRAEHADPGDVADRLPTAAITTAGATNGSSMTYERPLVVARGPSHQVDSPSWRLTFQAAASTTTTPIHPIPVTIRHTGRQLARPRDVAAPSTDAAPRRVRAAAVEAGVGGGGGSVSTAEDSMRRTVERIGGVPSDDVPGTGELAQTQPASRADVREVVDLLPDVERGGVHRARPRVRAAWRARS